jgi:hypothetical protein
VGWSTSRGPGQDAQEDAPLRRHVPRVLAIRPIPRLTGNAAAAAQSTATAVPRGGGARRGERSDDADAGGRRALGALADLELNALPLSEAAEARGVDFGVVDENVGAVAVLGDEAVALLPVERDRTLARGGSIWQATAHGLERRVDPTVTAAFESATGTGDVASAELTEAWIRAYGRDPDPSDAWDHAIKAVEAILIPIVVSEAGQAAVGSRDRCTRSTRATSGGSVCLAQTPARALRRSSPCFA